MKIIRLLTDILLFVITILLMNTNITGHLIHEVLGIIIVILIVIHLIINRKWIVSITKNFKKTRNNIKILYIVDILTFLFFLGTIIFGILISNQLFNFKTSGNAYLMFLHHIFGRLACLIMLVHLGLHLDIIISKITKNENIKNIIYIAYIIISTIFVLYLIYTLTNSYVWQSIV